MKINISFFLCKLIFNRIHHYANMNSLISLLIPVKLILSTPGHFEQLKSRFTKKFLVLVETALGQFAVGQFALGTVRCKKRKKKKKKILTKPNLTELNII